MRKTIFLLFSLFLLLGACQNVENPDKPENLIPESKMVDVLTDLSIMYAARNYNKSLFERTGITPSEEIYTKYEIDSLQFERSNDYYSNNYVQYEGIYNAVKARLELMQKSLDSIYEIEREMEDSVSIDSLQQDSLRFSKDSLKLDSIKTSRFRDRRRPGVKDSLILPPSTLDALQ